MEEKGRGMWDGALLQAALPVPTYARQPRNCPSSILLGSYGKFITSARCIINFIFSPSPFSREREWDWKFQASNHDLVFLETTPQAGSPLRVALLEQKILLSPMKLQGLQEHCVSNWGQRPILEQELLPVRILQGF